MQGTLLIYTLFNYYFSCFDWSQFRVATLAMRRSAITPKAVLTLCGSVHILNSSKLGKWTFSRASIRHQWQVNSPNHFIIEKCGWNSGCVQQFQHMLSNLLCYISSSVPYTSTLTGRIRRKDHFHTHLKAFQLQPYCYHHQTLSQTHSERQIPAAQLNVLQFVFSNYFSVDRWWH